MKYISATVLIVLADLPASSVALYNIVSVEMKTLNIWTKNYSEVGNYLY